MKLKSKFFGLLSFSAAPSIGGLAVTSLTQSIKQNELLNGNNKDDNNTDKDDNTENNTQIVLLNFLQVKHQLT